jgi:hypothetical protein
LETGYIVRAVAGDWWLIDTRQSGEPYRKPKRINRTAAEVINMIGDGKTTEEIAQTLHDQYGVAVEEAVSDVNNLRSQLGV